VIIPDVNVLVYAYRAEAADHESYRQWLEMVANGDESFALAGIVLSGFVRVVTHPGCFVCQARSTMRRVLLKIFCPDETAS
jgi:predicted nucleic acid-binding protein